MTCEKCIKNLIKSVKGIPHTFTLNELNTKFILMKNYQGKILVKTGRGYVWP